MAYDFVECFTQKRDIGEETFSDIFQASPAQLHTELRVGIRVSMGPKKIRTIVKELLKKLAFSEFMKNFVAEYKVQH